jgi:mitochondrial fission process protein 1
MTRNDKTQPDLDQLQSIEHERTEARPDFTKPLPRTKLPQDLQDTISNEEAKWWETFASGKGEDSTNTSVRYAAYANRLKTIMLSAQRYVAYTSDVGESFRPVAHPNMVRAAYGISWAYLVGDVSYEGYKAYQRNQAILHPAAAPSDIPGSTTTQQPTALTGHIAPIDHWGTVMAQRAVFQSIASMGLPAFTIHSIVRYSGQAMKNVKNARIRTWGPIGLGLAAVPALPFLFDKPVEEATEWVFHKAFETVGGPEAVGHKKVEETVEGGLGRRKEGVKEKEL